MRDVLLVKFGEVHLKGQNRPYFMRVLLENTRRAVAGLGGNVWMADSRLYVAGAPDMEECARRVRRVFGVHAVSAAVEVSKHDFQAINDQCVIMMRGRSGSFKVEARRSDKRYPLDSMQIAREVGHRIITDLAGQLTVDVHNPLHRLNIEIRDHAYLYLDSISAVGGMPVGTGGRAALLLSGGIDSPVAGYMIAKRGVTLSAVHFYSFPYTSERARQKVMDLAKIMAGYCGGFTVFMAPLTEAQLRIHRDCPDELGTILTRRMMMRIAERIAAQQGARALITGESLGQVASQTMEALAATDEVAEVPVFRPLIGMDKLEIIEMARVIGTYETSILPFEDCCTVFTPRHPATHPRIERVRKAEEALNVEQLIQEVLRGTQALQVEP